MPAVFGCTVARCYSGFVQSLEKSAVGCPRFIVFRNSHYCGLSTADRGQKTVDYLTVAFPIHFPIFALEKLKTQ